jgi:hypothetical protein
MTVLAKDEKCGIREGQNYRYLLDLLQADAAAYPTCLTSAVQTNATWPRWILGNAHVAKEKKVKTVNKTGHVTSAWFTAKSKEDANGIVQKAFAEFCPTSTIKMLKGSDPAVYQSEWHSILFATHLVFMVTEWLTNPGAYWSNPEFVPLKQREAVLDYCVMALHTVMQSQKCIFANAELFVELAGVVGVLRPAAAPEALSAARTMAMLTDAEWQRIMAAEHSRHHKSRYLSDILIHSYYLRGWIMRITDPSTASATNTTTTAITTAALATTPTASSSSSSSVYSAVHRAAKTTPVVPGRRSDQWCVADVIADARKSVGVQGVQVNQDADLPEVPQDMIRWFCPAAGSAEIAQDDEKQSQDDMLCDMVDTRDVRADLWAHPTTTMKWARCRQTFITWQKADEDNKSKLAMREDEEAESTRETAVKVLWLAMRSELQSMATYLTAYSRVCLGDTPPADGDVHAKLMEKLPPLQVNGKHVKAVLGLLAKNRVALQERTFRTTAMYLLGMALARQMAETTTSGPYCTSETIESTYGAETSQVHGDLLTSAPTYKELTVGVEKADAAQLIAMKACGNDAQRGVAQSYSDHYRSLQDYVRSDSRWCHELRRLIVLHCCNHKIFVPNLAVLRLGLTKAGGNMKSNSNYAYETVQTFCATHKGRALYNLQTHGPLASGEQPSNKHTVLPIGLLHDFLLFCVKRRGLRKCGNVDTYLAARARLNHAAENSTPEARLNAAESDLEMDAIKDATSIHSVVDLILNAENPTLENLLAHKKKHKQLTKAIQAGGAGIDLLVEKHDRALKASRAKRKREALEYLQGETVLLTATSNCATTPPACDLNMKDKEYVGGTTHKTDLGSGEGYEALLDALTHKDCPYNYMSNGEHIRSLPLIRRIWPDDDTEVPLEEVQRITEAHEYGKKMSKAAKDHLVAIITAAHERWGFPKECNDLWVTAMQPGSDHAQEVHQDTRGKGVANVMFHMTAGYKTQLQKPNTAPENWTTRNLTQGKAAPGDMYAFRANRAHRGPAHKKCWTLPRIVIFMAHGDESTDKKPTYHKDVYPAKQPKKKRKRN